MKRSPGDILVTPPQRSSYDFMPPPLPDDLRRLGLSPDDLDSPKEALGVRTGQDKATVYVRTRVSGALARVMDHIIERKLIPGVQTRSDLLHAAAYFYVTRLRDFLADDLVTTELAGLELAQRVYAARKALINSDEMAETIRKSVHLAIKMGDLAGARGTLYGARDFMGHLPEGVRRRFEAKVFGDREGIARPAGWEGDEVATMWDEVLREGEM